MFKYKVICKKCCKEYNRQHYEKNRQKIKLLHKLYRESNQEIFLKYRQSHKEEAREYSKIYASTHKKEASYRAKNRRELDINYRLIVNLRTRITRAVKNNWKSGSAVRDLGCSIFELKKWLENTFKINVKTGEIMSWNNYGKRWHIDHVIPLALFDLADKQQFLKACNYTNLQPLWVDEHKEKTIKDRKKIREKK